MTGKPWEGLAGRAIPADFEAVAQRLQTDLATITAIWEVEAAGNPFRKDGTLERRFEPHHMKPAQGDWRTSLKMTTAKREASFERNFNLEPEETLRATSWGAPQIMGFNHARCGFNTAWGMVEAFAQSEVSQLNAFASFILSDRKLWAAVRGHDWRTFAAIYNGKSNVDAYSAKIESAYRKHSGGTKSPVVLRIGATGPEVKKLQAALKQTEDGHFGPILERAVKDFQRLNGLDDDGRVGAITWQYLNARTGVVPVAQPSQGDVIGQASKLLAGSGVTVGGAVAVAQALPPQTVHLIVVAVLIGCALLAGVTLIQRVRR